MKNIIIAIDGYASCGKSTLAKALAKELRYAYIDSGAMYRAVTLYFLDNDVNFNDQDQIKESLLDIHITFKNIEGQNTTFLNHVNVERNIRDMRVSEAVSPVSAISAVRKEMVRMQQTMGQQRGIVMDGRDIGTVVFPDAELKLFMTAEPDIRTLRRVAEIAAKTGVIPDFDSVKNNLLTRDRLDSTREDSPLRQAEDAIVIDNSHISQEEQLHIALDLAKKLL